MSGARCKRDGEADSGSRGCREMREPDAALMQLSRRQRRCKEQMQTDPRPSHNRHASTRDTSGPTSDPVSVQAEPLTPTTPSQSGTPHHPPTRSPGPVLPYPPTPASSIQQLGCETATAASARRGCSEYRQERTRTVRAAAEDTASAFRLPRVRQCSAACPSLRVCIRPLAASARVRTLSLASPSRPCTHAPRVLPACIPPPSIHSSPAAHHAPVSDTSCPSPAHTRPRNPSCLHASLPVPPSQPQITHPPPPPISPDRAEPQGPSAGPSSGCPSLCASQSEPVTRNTDTFALSFFAAARLRVRICPLLFGGRAALPTRGNTAVTTQCPLLRSAVSADYARPSYQAQLALAACPRAPHPIQLLHFSNPRASRSFGRARARTPTRCLSSIPALVSRGRASHYLVVLFIHRRVIRIRP